MEEYKKTQPANEEFNLFTAFLIEASLIVPVIGIFIWWFNFNDGMTENVDRLLAFCLGIWNGVFMFFLVQKVYFALNAF